MNNLDDLFFIDSKIHFVNSSKQTKNVFDVFNEIESKLKSMFKCRRCNAFFYFNNKLHKHVKQCKVTIAEIVNVFYILKNIFIIEFTIIQINDVDYVFRQWRYVRMLINVVKNKSAEEFCVNNDITMSIIDCKDVLKQRFDFEMYRINETIRVRDIDNKWHDIFEYILLNFYIFDQIIIDQLTKIHFTREMHLINDLSIKIFIEINIIVSKQMIFDDAKHIVTIDNCDFAVKLNVIAINRVDRAVRVFKQFIISFHIYMIVSIKIRDQVLSIDRDYFFHSKKNVRFGAKNDFFVYITNVNLAVVQIKNAINQSIIIFRNFKLNKLQNYEEKNCYLIFFDDRHLIVKFSDWFKKAIKWIIVNIIDLIVFDNVFHEFIMSNISIVTSNIISVSIVSNLIFIDLKIVLFNDIIIYENVFVVVKLFLTAKVYFNIWQKKNHRYDQHIRKKLNVCEHDIWNQIRINSCVQAKQTKAWRHWQEIRCATQTRKNELNDSIYFLRLFLFPNLTYNSSVRQIIWAKE